MHPDERRKLETALQERSGELARGIPAQARERRANRIAHLMKKAFNQPCASDTLKKWRARPELSRRPPA